MPAVSGKAVMAALMRAGFQLDRASGSHFILKHPGPPPRSVVVPVHGRKELKRGTIGGILRQAGMSADEFVSHL